MNTLFILFLLGLVAVNIGFYFLKKRMNASTKPTSSSIEEFSNRYAVVFAVPESKLLGLAVRATSKAIPQQYENIVKECARALKQRLDMEERNSLDELLARYAVLEYVPKDELTSLAKKAISPKTPISQYEKIVERAARNLRQKKASELAKVKKEEESKNLD